MLLSVCPLCPETIHVSNQLSARSSAASTMQAPFGGAQSAANAAMDTPSNKLFFAGLPDSLTEETFRAMMEKFPGFEAARLRHDRAGQWVGFVDFKEESEATACKNAMAGAKLDPNNSALVTVRYSGQKAKAGGRSTSGWSEGEEVQCTHSRALQVRREVSVWHWCSRWGSPQCSRWPVTGGSCPPASTWLEAACPSRARLGSRERSSGMLAVSASKDGRSSPSRTRVPSFSR